MLGTPQGVQTLYRNAALLDPRQSQFDAVCDDCYFCVVDMYGCNQRKKKGWHYLDIESAR